MSDLELLVHDYLRAFSDVSGHRHTAPQLNDPEARRGHTDRPILVAENQSADRELLVRQLERRGHRVRVARTGPSALQVMKQGQVALTLMACQMPELDAYQATRTFREYEAATNSGRHPIIAMIADTIADDVERCMEAGMDGYLVKPLRTFELLTALDRCLVRRRAGEPVAAAYRAPRICDVLDAGPIELLAQRMSPDELEQLLELFVRCAEDTLDTIAAATEGRERRAVAAPARALYGLALNYGATRLAAAAESLEQAALSGAAGLDDPVNSVERAWPPTLAALQLMLTMARDC